MISWVDGFFEFILVGYSGLVVFVNIVIFGVLFSTKFVWYGKFEVIFLDILRVESIVGKENRMSIYFLRYRIVGKMNCCVLCCIDCNILKYFKWFRNNYKYIGKGVVEWIIFFSMNELYNVISFAVWVLLNYFEGFGIFLLEVCESIVYFILKRKSFLEFCN